MMHNGFIGFIFFMLITGVGSMGQTMPPDSSSVILLPISSPADSSVYFAEIRRGEYWARQKARDSSIAANARKRNLNAIYVLVNKKPDTFIKYIEIPAAIEYGNGSAEDYAPADSVKKKTKVGKFLSRIF